MRIFDPNAVHYLDQRVAPWLSGDAVPVCALHMTMPAKLMTTEPEKVNCAVCLQWIQVDAMRRLGAIIAEWPGKLSPAGGR